MKEKILWIILAVVLLSPLSLAEWGGVVGYVNYQSNFPKPDRIYIESLTDPKVKNVVCYIGRALRGGVGGITRLVIQPSRLSISCETVGKAVVTKPLDVTERGETILTEAEGLGYYKHLVVTRFVDRNRCMLVYLVWTTEIIEGAPYNAISTVPIDCKQK